MNDQEFYISVQQGGTAALPCRVQSTPPPTLRSAVSNVWISLRKATKQIISACSVKITIAKHLLCFSWFHVNSNLLQPVSYGPRLHSVAHMLLVEDARPEDGGQYRCTARNEMGELSVTLHLQVEPPLVVGEFYSRFLFVWFIISLNHCDLC